MRSKSFFIILIVMIGFTFLGCAVGGIFPIPLKYQPQKEFPSLQQRLGSVVGIAPTKDERSETQYIGHHTSFRGISSYFKSDPFPLGRVIEESIRNVASCYGIKVIPILTWDGKPGSLKNIEADSILMIEIQKFWIEGKALTFRTEVKSSIYFNVHLGVKKEGKVYSRKIYMDRELKVAGLTPEKVENIMNQILNDIFDHYFSNPYEMSTS